MDPALNQHQPEPQVVRGLCAICGAASVKHCKACGDGDGTSGPVFYCSREHQTQDWSKGHRFVCTATVNSRSGIVTKIDQQFGLTYQAARDLPVGHVLFSKDPLLVIPKAPTGMSVFMATTSTATAASDGQLCICLGCNEVLLYSGIVQKPPGGPYVGGKCEKCGWPLHSRVLPREFREHEETQGDPNICERSHEKECEILTRAGLTWDKIKDRELAYTFIGVLRAVMLQDTDKAAFANLRVRDWTEERYQANQAEKVSEWLRICGFELQKSLVRVYILKIKTNMLPIPRSAVPNNKRGYVLYKGAPAGNGRILSHSCMPNVNLIFDSVSMKGCFKTMRPVKKGEELHQSYLFETELYLPADGRKGLLAALGTSCDCPRCSDPVTEAGSYSHALKCPGGANHWFLPRVRSRSHQNEIELDHVFQCNKCGALKPVTKVNELVFIIQDEFEETKGYASRKAFIAKYSGKIVHPTHFILQRAWIRIGVSVFSEIIHQYSRLKSHPNEWALDLHSKYMSDLERVLQIMNVVHPGRVQYTGQFLYARSILLMTQLVEEVVKAKPAGGHVYEDRIGKIIEEAREAWSILTESPYNTLFNTAQYKTVRLVYANHLVAALEPVYLDLGKMGENDNDDACKPPNFTIFKKEFADAQFDPSEIIDFNCDLTNPDTCLDPVNANLVTFSAGGMEMKTIVLRSS